MENKLDFESPTDTGGIQLRTRQAWLADSVELLSSMRFAISILVLIAIGAVIGTVLKQNEPMPNYVNQFGPFWYEVLDKFGLYSVYSAWWFLLMVGLLVVSTSLCVIRNAPKMLKDMRSWRDNVREQSLRNFHHRGEWTSAQQPATVQQRAQQLLASLGYQQKLVAKDGATLIAARQGAANKWGYILAHSAIVVIVLGAMLDSELPIRLQRWFGGKVPYEGAGIIANIPEQHRLPLGNPSFRGNSLIPEGSSSNTAIITQSSGVLIQDLPFTLQLKKFHIDFYSSGMPKLFASDVILTDHETGKKTEATIKVNQPLIYQGIAVYQSSFEDGGSRLQVQTYAMTGDSATGTSLKGEVGGSTPLTAADQQSYSIEWTGFRPFNVENMAKNGTDVRAVDTNKSFNERLSADLSKQLGSAAKNVNTKEFKNVGPSFQYKLRDQTGQAKEFMNYMQPMLIDGDYMILSGVRESTADGFRFLRIPADDNDSVTEWMRLRAALHNKALREKAADRFAASALPASMANSGDMRQQIQASAANSLAIFAGNGQDAGFVAISRYLEQKIPAADQAKAADVMIKILNGSLWNLWMLAREQDGLPALEMTDKHARFLQLATTALSDAAFYHAPVYLQLRGFDEVKASVLQITRSPGKNVVYFGCLLLVLGVFAMFYIRERRLWIWLKADGQGSHILMAMSSQRKTLDFEKEFAQLSQGLTAIAQEDKP